MRNATVKFNGLPPQVVFDASFEEVDKQGYRQCPLVLGKVTLPDGKLVHFHVSVGIDGRDNVYVKVGNQRDDRAIFFRPKQIRP